MSHRHPSYDKGSSRSARDDYRPSRDGRERERLERGDGGRRRDEPERSRSPRRRSPEARPDARSRSDRPRDTDRREHRNYHDDSEEDVPTAPPPPRITKISIDFAKPKVAPIKLNIGGPSKVPAVQPKPTVASVFNDDDDDEEPEEMPAEARMRMRNIGRETPTSAGPNSFGKTKQGFCDSKKLFEKNLKEALDSTPSQQPHRLPQTIYKLKGP